MSQFPSYGSDPGWPPSQPAYAMPNGMLPPTSGWAVASLICGVLGLLTCCAFVPSVLGVVFGGVALPGINRGAARGKGLAVAGLITGVLGLLLGVVAWIVMATANFGDSTTPISGDEVDPLSRMSYESSGAVQPNERIIMACDNSPDFICDTYIVTEDYLAIAWSDDTASRYPLVEADRIELEPAISENSYGRIFVRTEDGEVVKLEIHGRDGGDRTFFDELVVRAKSLRKKDGRPEPEIVAPE